MKAKFAKYISKLAKLITATVVIGTASWTWLHNREVPQELKK